jgi:hypothetical protein
MSTPKYEPSALVLRIQEERREQRRAYVAEWRAMNPDKRAAAAAKQNAKRRAERARMSNLDLITEL